MEFSSHKVEMLHSRVDEVVKELLADRLSAELE